MRLCQYELYNFGTNLILLLTAVLQVVASVLFLYLRLQIEAGIILKSLGEFNKILARLEKNQIL